MRGLGPFGVGPAQQPEGEEQGVRATFLQPLARLAEQAGQRGIEVLGREPDQQFAPGQCAARHLVPGRLAGAVAQDFGRARVLAVHDLRLGAQAELAAIGQRIFQRGEVGCGDAQRRLRRLEVEQPVAQGQVEQLRLPLRQPALGRVVGAGVDDPEQCRVERRQVWHGLDGASGCCRGAVGGRRGGVARRAAAVHCHRLRRQRPDMHRARAPDVDRIQELSAIGEVALPLLERDTQRWPLRRVLCDAGGLEHQQLAARHPLAHRLHVIDQRIRERGVVQPGTDPRMAFLQQHHGPEAGLFQAGGEQHGQVEAAAHPVLEDAARRAHLLPVGAERGRRLDILQPLVAYGGVERRHLLPYRLAAFRLVAVHRQPRLRRLQQLRSLAHQRIDRRVVRHGEGRQQFRQ